MKALGVPEPVTSNERSDELGGWGWVGVGAVDASGDVPVTVRPVK